MPNFMEPTILDMNSVNINTDAVTSTQVKSPSIVETITLDSVIRLCGDLGRFQLVHLFFLNLISMSAGIVAFYYVFGAADPEHRCRLPQSVWPNDVHYWSVNQTHLSYINAYIPKDNDGKWNKCQRRKSAESNSTLINCPNGWAYDRSVYGRTFTEEADFVCSNEPKKSWLSTVMQTGGFTLIVIGSLGDKFGRRKVTIVTTVSMFILCILTQIPIQWIPMTVDAKFGLLLVNHLISGLTISTYSCAFILILEITSAAHTSLAGNTGLVAFTIGEAVITLFAYLTYDWQKLKWTNTLFIGLVLPYLYFIPETPHYLYAKQKYNELEKLLRRMATQNRRAEIEWYPSYQILIRNRITLQDHDENKMSFFGQVYRLFTHKSSIVKLIISNLIGFSTYLLYYEISYGLEVLNVSPYLGVLIGAVVEAVGYISGSILIVTRLGRKGTFFIMLGLAAACVVIVPLINKHNTTATVFITQFGKYAVSGAICVSWIFIPELFQTAIRSSANGLFIASSHLGAILAPVIETTVNADYLPIAYYVSAGLAVIVLLLTILLPETKDKVLDD